MNRSTIVMFALFSCLCCAAGAWGADDELKPWEKLGISQTEWKMIGDNHISEKKVNEILAAGIGVGEYVGKPWKSLGLTEREWINKRRSGLTSYDIELEAKPSRQDWKADSKSTLKTELSTVSSNKDLFVSFAIPGLQQSRLKERWRGDIMGGLAIMSLAGCLVGSVAEGRFEVIPLCILVPDMFWSFFDFKITRAKMDQ